MADADNNDASGLLVTDANEEDSVDIYDGLDVVFNSSGEKSPPVGSQLKESMDLYEEIVTEERQSRESSYTELQSRFQAAQNQIKELHRRLEQMEIQNTRLTSENHCLKKNISALLRTARQEVTRKDAEIQRLNQRSDKSHHHHQSHINHLRDANSSSRSSTLGSTSRPLPPPLPSLPPPPPPPPPLPSLPPPPPPPSSLPPPLPPPLTSLPREGQPPRNPPQPSRKESDSLTRASNASPRSHSTRVDKQTESDKPKPKHKEEKYHSQKVSESADRTHRSCSDPNKDSHVPEKTTSHKAGKDTARRFDSRSCKSRNYLSVEAHRRSDGARTSSPEILHGAASSNDKKGSRRERRPDPAKVVSTNSEHVTAHSLKEGYSQEHRKIKTGDRHSRTSESKDRRKSSSNQHPERYGDSSKEREGDRQKAHHGNGDRRREGETSRKQKRSSQSETSRDREKQRSIESDQDKVNIRSKDRQKKTQEAFKGLSEAPNMGEKSSVEENSPNRKLCFMETLNLTLSPIKKPTLPIDGSQNDATAEDKNAENRPDEESSLPDIEDMCVIDEVDSTELSGEQSPDNVEASNSETGHDRIDDVEGVQEKIRSCSETPAADNPVQTTSARSQALDPSESQTAGHVTPNSPESSFLNAVDRNKPVSDGQVAECGPPEATCGTDPSETPGSVSEPHTSSILQNDDPGNDASLSAAVTEPTVEPPQTAVLQNVSPDLPAEAAASSPPQEPNAAENTTDEADPKSQETPPTPCPAVSHSSTHEKDCCGKQDGPEVADAESSTISLESLPQEGLSLTEAIYVLTRTNEDANDTGSSTGCTEVSKVGSTTEEKSLPERCSGPAVTPKKDFSPGKKPENELQPYSSAPLLHDEDSMMRTLSNLKRIPDAISPLRSPVRITKRSLLHVHGKPGHVKSLQKDFSGTAVDAGSKKLDVNKENKYPGSPVNLVDKVSDLPLSLSDTDLEEGEILSESDEAAVGSPVPATKRAKLAQPVRNKGSPTFGLKGKSLERRVASKEPHDTASTSTRSPKSRFKTVCPAASKASFSTIEEIMETFRLVRTEIRKKYMKLHKTFPRKSFYGVMENFQESFLEFVDGAHFGQICSQAADLKSKLKKLIASVFNKVSNNGIVKRIFEQQAVDLKQKLWDFVDIQVDYLFKDIHTTLKSFCKPGRAQAEDKRSSEDGKIHQQPAEKTPQCQQKEAQSPPASLSWTKPSAVAPYKTGLGSRGKDIRITHVEKDRTADLLIPPKHLPSTPEKNNMPSLVVAQNGSLLDKTDFQLLTEQQASSLTFNLVRDSQMGEIFKCLLQGSDLLESSGISGENTTWSLGTPRKDGERFISITTPSKLDSPSKLLSPVKFDTPSKLIATWSSISPRKLTSPHPKDHIPLNPALFDESCLLEVPSENRALLQASKSFSILAEDLAVSLTIPSPLKSDSHLSFLQPSSMSMHIMSTPDSVISAHISEDALLDGEDATEQDIHLALDTDNSSCCSSGSAASEILATSFVFTPDMPMQALVMEKSNDHFIVKIRQANAGADTTLTLDESLSRTLTDEDQLHGEVDAGSADKSQKDAAPCRSAPAEQHLPERSGICQAETGSGVPPGESLKLMNDPSNKEDSQHNTSKVRLSKDSLETQPEAAPSDNSVGSRSSVPHTVTLEDGPSRKHLREEDVTQSPSKVLSCELEERISPPEAAASNHSLRRPTESQASRPHTSDSERDEMDTSELERSLAVAEDTSSSPRQLDCGKGRKRKKHRDKLKVKRLRKDGEVSPGEVRSSPRKDDEESKLSPASLSPNSLSAKNVVRKKGEVVMAWTRHEDRAILIDLKTKGASRDTFSALSEKLNKPSEQIAHRFHQLMKLFKKQEKMDT